jgi:DNA polymerase I
MIALLDGDTIAYRCAASCEPSKRRAQELGIPFEELEREPLDIAIKRADELVYRIFNTCQTDKYRIFLSGSENFRKLLYPDYKANRAKLPRPEWLDPCREFLVTEWGAEITAGYEADDGIGIAASKDFVICANDKDFRQIPGSHYNFVKDTFEEVSEEVAAFNFYASLLIGDTSDNVRGVDGIGPVKAGRLLRNKHPSEMESIVIQHYGDRERFVLVHTLLRILRSEEEYENTVRKIQGTKPPEASSTEDLSPFSTVNS